MTIKERVAAGAAELDIVWPGWYRIVDPRKLQLESGCNCVLGQLESFEREGNEPESMNFFSAGLARFTRWRRAMGRRGTGNIESRFGFVATAQIGNEYDRLTTHWKAEIRERRKATR